jgi:putative DNA primase/helicase
MPPGAVLKASNDWAEAVDHLKRFISEDLIQEPGHKVAGGSMYDHYEAWCKRNGETPLGRNELPGQLKTAHNLTHKRTKRGSEWVNVKFRLR